MKTALALSTALGLLLGCTAIPAIDESRFISPDEAIGLVTMGNAVFVDIRTETQKNAGGKSNVIAIPFDSGDFVKKVSALNMGDSKILLFCQRGVASVKALRQLQNVGIVNTYSVNGGWLGENGRSGLKSLM